MAYISCKDCCSVSSNQWCARLGRSMAVEEVAEEEEEEEEDVEDVKEVVG